MSDMLVGILGLAVIAAVVVSLTKGKMLPAMISIGQAFGLQAPPIAITMQIMRVSATFICPMTAALLLGAEHGGSNDQKAHQGQLSLRLELLDPVPAVRRFHGPCFVLGSGRSAVNR